MNTCTLGALSNGNQVVHVWLQKPGLAQEKGEKNQTDLVHKAVSNFTPFCPTNLIANGGQSGHFVGVSCAAPLLLWLYFVSQSEFKDDRGGKRGPSGYSPQKKKKKKKPFAHLGLIKWMELRPR